MSLDIRVPFLQKPTVARRTKNVKNIIIQCIKGFKIRCGKTFCVNFHEENKKFKYQNNDEVFLKQVELFHKTIYFFILF